MLVAIGNHAIGFKRLSLKNQILIVFDCHIENRCQLYHISRYLVSGVERMLHSLTCGSSFIIGFIL